LWCAVAVASAANKLRMRRAAGNDRLGEFVSFTSRHTRSLLSDRDALVLFASADELDAVAKGSLAWPARHADPACGGVRVARIRGSALVREYQCVILHRSMVAVIRARRSVISSH
jgi:hypothetical protein